MKKPFQTPGMMHSNRLAINLQRISPGKPTATPQQKHQMLAQSEGLCGTETLYRKADGSLFLRIVGIPHEFTHVLTGAEESDDPQDIAINRATAIAWGKRHQCWDGR